MSARSGRGCQPNGRRRRQVGARQVQLGDRPVRLGKPQGPCRRSRQDQPLRAVPLKAPDVQVGCDDRGAVCRQLPAASTSRGRRASCGRSHRAPRISPSLGTWATGAACAGPGAAMMSNASTTTRRRISGHDSDGMPRLSWAGSRNLGRPRGDDPARPRPPERARRDRCNASRASGDRPGRLRRPATLPERRRALQAELEPREPWRAHRRGDLGRTPRPTPRAEDDQSTSFCTTAASSTSRSSIPHPRMAERMFVLSPRRARPRPGGAGTRAPSRLS